MVRTRHIHDKPFTRGKEKSDIKKMQGTYFKGEGNFERLVSPEFERK